MKGLVGAIQKLGSSPICRGNLSHCDSELWSVFPCIPEFCKRRRFHQICVQCGDTSHFPCLVRGLCLGSCLFGRSVSGQWLVMARTLSPRAQMPIQPSGKETEEMEAEGDSAAEMNGEADESEEERSASQTESEEESSGEPLHLSLPLPSPPLIPSPPPPLRAAAPAKPVLIALSPQRWMTRTMSGAAVSVSVRCWTWKSSSRS